MMHGPEKSDPCIVAAKPANKSGDRRRSRWSEGRGPRGTRSKQRMRRTPSRESMSSGLERVRERARPEKKEQFTALLHHVDVDLLRACFFVAQAGRGPRVDGMTWREYEQNLEENLVDLHARVHRGAYRAQPSRRKFIPKADGREAAAWDRCAGRQDRPACGGGGAQCDLRGRLSGVLVRVPARTRPA